MLLPRSASWRATVKNLLLPLWRALPLSHRQRVVIRGSILTLLHPLVKDTVTFSNHLKSVASVAAGPATVPLGPKSCLILTTPHSLFLAQAIHRELSELGLYPHISFAENDAWNPNFAYRFVLSPHNFPSIPIGSYVIQLEQLQSDRWNNPTYLERLRRYESILEYSDENIETEVSFGIPYQQIYYLPTDLLSHYNDHRPPVDRDIDVLFYGDIYCDRRTRILSRLSERFNVEIVHGRFGPEMQELIRRAKVVVNIHYYEDAKLEAMRIFECLSLGTPVVSERSVDIAAYPGIESVVDFVREGDAEGLADAVASLLGSATLYQSRIDSIERLAAKPSRFRSYFRRFLLAKGLISFESFYATAHGYAPANLDAIPKLCLTLPETPGRRKGFSGHGLGFQRFDGLRSTPGWRGCGLSYKYLFRHLRDSNVRAAIVSEDDALLPTDFAAKLQTIMTYLEDRGDDWDVFSGFIADLSPQAKVTGVEAYRGERFVSLDKAVSMVFNIYSKSAIAKLAEWDESGHDPLTNTFDRFMERQGLRFITTAPFLVGHEDHQTSTLWGVTNSHYTPLIRASERLLEEKIAVFATKPVGSSAAA